MVDVLLFADLQEAVGKEKLSFDADGLSVKELKDKWLNSYELENINYLLWRQASL